MKHYLVTLELRAGELEFDQQTLISTYPGEDIEEKAQAYLGDFWGPSEPEGDGVMFTSVDVYGEVKGWSEIPADHFAILSTYIH